MIWLGITGNMRLLPAESRTFTEQDIEPRSIEQRTASGRLVRDVGALKKSFTLSYDIVTNQALQMLRQLYMTNLSQSLVLQIERETGVFDSYFVVFRPFSRQRFIVGNTWYWTDITVELEEV